MKLCRNHAKNSAYLFITLSRLSACDTHRQAKNTKGNYQPWFCFLRDLCASVWDGFLFLTHQHRQKHKYQNISKLQFSDCVYLIISSRTITLISLIFFRLLSLVIKAFTPLTKPDTTWMLMHLVFLSYISLSIWRFQLLYFCPYQSRLDLLN